MSKTLQTFGDDLAFAGIDSIDIVGKVVLNPVGQLGVEVHVKDGEYEAVVPDFISIEQAEAAISLAHAGAIKDAIVGYDNRWRFDFVVGVLSMVANVATLFPTPNRGENL